MHILVTGASGSGTSTLGQALASEFGFAFTDADDLFWLPTDPPFKTKRNRDERAALLRSRLAVSNATVIAGSIEGWDQELEDAFGLIVFLSAPPEVRVARLRERELARFGRVDESFIEWAAQYDVGAIAGRSLARQLAWLHIRTCPILPLSGIEPIPTLVAVVHQQVRNSSIERTSSGRLRWLPAAARVER